MTRAALPADPRPPVRGAVRPGVRPDDAGAEIQVPPQPVQGGAVLIDLTNTLFTWT